MLGRNIKQIWGTLQGCLSRMFIQEKNSDSMLVLLKHKGGRDYNPAPAHLPG
jgi:hypothetical protein